MLNSVCMESGDMLCWRNTVKPLKSHVFGIYKYQYVLLIYLLSVIFMDFNLCLVLISTLIFFFNLKKEIYAGVGKLFSFTQQHKITSKVIVESDTKASLFSGSHVF